MVSAGKGGGRKGGRQSSGNGMGDGPQGNGTMEYATRGNRSREQLTEAERDVSDNGNDNEIRLFLLDINIINI